MYPAIGLFRQMNGGDSGRCRLLTTSGGARGMTIQHDVQREPRDSGHDPVVDARHLQVYVQLSDAPYAYGEILDARRVVNYAADGTPIGAEFLEVSGCVNLCGIPNADRVAAALRGHDIPVCA
jgi:hypothetical protein